MKPQCMVSIPFSGTGTRNKSLQRSGGLWYLVCALLTVIDKVPMISLGEPPGAELSRWAP
jgi:hypothetical protein